MPDRRSPGIILLSKITTACIPSFGYDAHAADWWAVVTENRIANHTWNLPTSLASCRENDDTVGTRYVDKATVLIWTGMNDRLYLSDMA